MATRRKLSDNIYCLINKTSFHYTSYFRINTVKQTSNVVIIVNIFSLFFSKRRIVSSIYFNPAKEKKNVMPMKTKYHVLHPKKGWGWKKNQREFIKMINENFRFFLNIQREFKLPAGHWMFYNRSMYKKIL